jgi:hypothetical protein
MTAGQGLNVRPQRPARPDLELVSIQISHFVREYGCRRVLAHLQESHFNHKEEQPCQKQVRSLAIAAGQLATKN